MPGPGKARAGTAQIEGIRSGDDPRGPREAEPEQEDRAAGGGPGDGPAQALMAARGKGFTMILVHSIF